MTEINLVERAVSKPIGNANSIETQLKTLPEIDIKLVKNKIEKIDADLMSIGREFCTNTIKNASVQLETLTTDLHGFSFHLYNLLLKDLVARQINMNTQK